MTPRLIFRVFALGLWLILGPQSMALAQGSKVALGGNHDSSLPVEITSEQLQVDQEKGVAEFSGDVIVGQGNITMTCSLMRVEYAANSDTGKNEIRVIRMFGGVTFVGDGEAAESDTAVYTLANDTLIMTDNVLLTQGSTALSSDKLTYNLKSGEGLMEGRVKTILQPKSN